MSKSTDIRLPARSDFAATALRRMGAVGLVAMLVLGHLFGDQALADPVPVRLKVAYGQNYAASGMTWNWTTVQVKVQNLAYEKQVTMHYRDPADNNWKDQPLPFMAHYGNYDVFGSDSHSLPAAKELAIRYNVSGKEYWDNNNTANYRTDALHGAVGGNVMLNEAKAVVYNEPAAGQSIPVSRFQGQIYVQNLSYHKIVGVRWSRDGGKTWTNTNGAYGGKVMAVAGEVPEVEIWNFQTPTLTITDASVPFRFAVFYEQRNNDNSATVATYWDNNFTQDYYLPQSQDATIR
jgi:hypothetical protein